MIETINPVVGQIAICLRHKNGALRCLNTINNIGSLYQRAYLNMFRKHRGNLRCQISIYSNISLCKKLYFSSQKGHFSSQKGQFWSFQKILAGGGGGGTCPLCSQPILSPRLPIIGICQSEKHSMFSSLILEIHACSNPSP